MFGCRKERSQSLGRFCLAALLVVTLLAAGLLNVSPGWHERFHPDTATTHLCVVTLFASGHCESATPAPVFAPPAALPLLATLPLPATPSLSTAHFFSLLEHAPPSLA
jgi:hypothetical protein